jgi:predicted metal-dependent phosphoesterase TrpH/glycosyltransferase involved in cell wall biosynthesis
MGSRICLVTPFAWSQPHPVNEHVAGAAAALASRGHSVTILAPSTRARDLAAGRRALRRLARDAVELEGLVALGPALPLASGNRIGVPVGVRANLELALARGGFDVVHGHEPGLASLSYLALRDAEALAVATFHDPDRLGYPPGKRQRVRLLGRIDALTATSAETAASARERFPGDYRVLPAGIDTELFRPGAARKRFVLEWDAECRPLARAAIRGLRALPGWQLVVLRPTAISGRPYVPRDLRRRVSVQTRLDPRARAEALRGAAGLVAGADAGSRLRLEAAASGVPLVAPPARLEQPELVAAAMQRLASDPDHRSREAQEARSGAEAHSLERLGAELDSLYRSLTGRRRVRDRREPLAGRPWILADLHMHTEHSHDCSIPVAELLEHAAAIGLGAIAITDHNVFGGALEAVELARGGALRVIPGEEVKTDEQGEVIGLFLGEAIPAGMSFADTVAAIREQGGLVYLPHPFDRLHAIPDTTTLHRHLAEIDVLEAFNARLLFEAFNDEAARFARKYNLLAGAGSDAHVLQGVGTGLVRMRAFETPEEFLLALGTAEIVRRPKSLLYLQGLKWVAQARERRLRATMADR